MISNYPLRVAVLITLFAGEVPVVLAQTRDTKPLFGDAGPQSGARPRSLEITGSLSTAEDGDSGSTLQPSGQYSVLDTALSFAQTRRRFGVVARAASSLRHYADLKSFTESSDSAGMAFTVNLGRKTVLQTRLDASHVSSLAFDTFTRQSGLGQESSSTPGVENASVDSTIATSYGGTMALTRTVGRRSSFGLSYGLGHSERSIVGQRDDQGTVAAQFGRTIGRDASFRVAYNFHEDLQRIAGERAVIWSHDAQFGVERQWRHSKFQQTAISFAGGPSLREEPSIPQGGERTRLLSIVGAVAVNQTLSDRWSARISYRRGAGLRDGLVFSNAAALDVVGRIGRRVDLTLSGGYSDGDIGVAALQNRYRSSLGSARLQVALARFVAAYGQYVVHHYDFGTNTLLPTGSPRQSNQRGLRAGVALWLPLRQG